MFVGFWGRHLEKSVANLADGRKKAVANLADGRKKAVANLAGCDAHQ
jgi:hypothetical protein